MQIAFRKALRLLAATFTALHATNQRTHRDGQGLSNTPLLEVKVIPLKPEKWEWQVCDRDTPIVMGYETTRETAQVKGDSAPFLLLSL
jgi:hypothetical protein